MHLNVCLFLPLVCFSSAIFAQAPTDSALSDKIARQQTEIDQLRTALADQTQTLARVLQLLEPKSTAKSDFIKPEKPEVSAQVPAAAKSAAASTESVLR